jgi:hypothetical protein
MYIVRHKREQLKNWIELLSRGDTRTFTKWTKKAIFSAFCCMSRRFVTFGNAALPWNDNAIRLSLLAYLIQAESFLSRLSRAAPHNVHSHHPNLNTHCKSTGPKIGTKYSQNGNRAASVLISTFIYLWAIYIFPRSVCQFGGRKIVRPIVGIYKSLTDIWN